MTLSRRDRLWAAILTILLLAAPAVGATYRTKSQALLRASPSARSAALATLASGETVEVSSCSSNVVQRQMARAKRLDRTPKPHPLRESSCPGEVRPRLPELRWLLGTVATAKPERTAAWCVSPMQRRHVQLLQTPQWHLLAPRRSSAMVVAGGRTGRSCKPP